MKLAKKLLATTMACATAFGMTACGGGASLELDYDYTESDKKIEYTFFLRIGRISKAQRKTVS